MNAAFFLRPKSEVTFLYADAPLPQALADMHSSRYSSVPVIGRDGMYVSTVSEGDFLYALAQPDAQEIRLADAEKLRAAPLSSILREDRNPPCHINVAIEELLERTAAQNFVPIVDDRGIFIGIVTRRSVIQFFLKSRGECALKA